MKLRVGIVGLGEHWETRQLPALNALSDRYEVRAICDPVWHRAERAARQLGAHALGGFRTLAERDDVDAVLLLSAQFYGALPIHAACANGKAVYCAADLNLCQDAAFRLRDLVRAAGVAFMAGFRCRQAASTVRLKELIATRLGAPRFIFAEHRESHSGLATGSYRSSAEKLIERIDWCRYLVGREPASVLGLVNAPSAGGVDESYMLVSLDFPSESGQPSVLAEVREGRYLSEKWRDAVSFRAPAAFQVVCERGVAFVDLPNRITWFDEAGHHTETLEGELSVDQQLLLAFHRAVTSLVLHSSHLDDAYRALTVALMAQRSAQLGRRLPMTWKD